MMFGQLTGARSLRDVQALLESHAARLYHSGLSRVKRSTLADANKKRPLEVFTGLFSAMVDALDRRLRRELGELVCLMDASVIKPTS
jgi:Domain of unknown function (DUF4372)